MCSEADFWDHPCERIRHLSVLVYQCVNTDIPDWIRLCKDHSVEFWCETVRTIGNLFYKEIKPFLAMNGQVLFQHVARKLPDHTVRKIEQAQKQKCKLDRIAKAEGKITIVEVTDWINKLHKSASEILYCFDSILNHETQNKSVSEAEKHNYVLCRRMAAGYLKKLELVGDYLDESTWNVPTHVSVTQTDNDLVRLKSILSHVHI